MIAEKRFFSSFLFFSFQQRSGACIYLLMSLSQSMCWNLVFDCSHGFLQLLGISTL